MKNNNELVYDIITKAKRLRNRQKNIKATAIITAIVTLITSWNLLLFLPFPKKPDRLEQYKNHEYYSIIRTIDDFVTTVEEEDDYKNNFQKWTGNFGKGIKNGFKKAWNGVKKLWPFKKDADMSIGVYPELNGQYEEVTNNQVDGVIEGDLFKRTDRYIFHLRSGLSAGEELEATYGDSNVYQGDGYVLSVYDINKENTKRVGKYEIKPENGMKFYPVNAEMFLSEDGNTVNVIAVCYNENSEFYTTAISLDVSNVQNVVQRARKYVSGTYKTSRMVGDELLLLASYQAQRNPDYNKPEQYLPHTGTLNKMSTLKAEDIHLPKSATSAVYTVVTAMDAKSLAQYDAHAFLSYSDSVYVSKDKVFATTSYTTVTDTGKQHEYLDMTDISCLYYTNKSIELFGTVSVEGKVKNQYSMDEFNGYLRVFTTYHASIYEETVRGDNVSIRWIKNETNANFYAINLSSLSIVASKEGFAPDGETVESARFDGNKAYACTAVVATLTDPVFVFDLSDYSNVTYTDTGAINGYSFALTKFKDNTLLGLGYDGNRNFKIELYKEAEDSVQSVASYELANASVTENYKAYYIDASAGYIGLYDANARQYIMLHYDGAKLYEVFRRDFISDGNSVRACVVDGWAYILGSNGMKARALLLID